MAYFWRFIDLIIFPQTKVTTRNENFIVIPDSICLNFQVHITREHKDVLSHAVIDLTQCVTKGVLIMLDIFPNVHSVVHNVFKIIQKS